MPGNKRNHNLAKLSMNVEKNNMSYKKSYFLLSIGVIVGAVVVFIGLVAMLGGIMQALIFFKCPKCGMLLKIRGKKPNCCHGCGYRLDL